MVGKYLLQKRYEEAMKNYLARPYSKETKNHREFRKKIEENWGNFNLKNIPNHLILEKKVINYLSKKPHDFQNAFKILPKQILTLFIHAYQSKLFNNVLARYIQENFEKNYKIKYCYGKLPIINQDLNLNLPLIGYDYKFKDNKIDNYLKNLLEKDNIELKDFKFKESFNVVHNDISFIYYLYHLYMDKEPEIKISHSEHRAYIWSTPQDALKLNLVQDEDSVIKKMFNMI